MYCKKCNAKLSDTATVCGLCGCTELATTPQQAASITQAPVTQAPDPWTAEVPDEARTVYVPTPYPTLPKKSKRKLWNWAGLVLGIVTIIAGLVFVFTDPDFHGTSGASSASFGADFYTYQYKATQAVAANTISTVAYLRQIEATLMRIGGMAFMVAGALIVIHFGKQCFSDEKA